MTPITMTGREWHALHKEFRPVKNGVKHIADVDEQGRTILRPVELRKEGELGVDAHHDRKH